jgi:L-ascorbate metabolism protein UlaG (beta-lactamase superfamily)
LIDPYLGAKGSGVSYAGRQTSPLVELPMPAQEVVTGIDLVLVSHLHSDHFDATAWELLAKDIPIFCQPGEELELAEKGFTNATPVMDSVVWEGISIHRTAGQHGTGAVLDDMGLVSGFVFEAENEPILYWAGDTVWCAAVAQAIDQFKPKVIVTHSAGALWNDNLILMDAAQTVAVCRAAPDSIVIATHMDAVDHATVSRLSLRGYAIGRDISPEQLFIPADGEILVF